MHILNEHGKYYFFNDFNIEDSLKPKNYVLNWDAHGNCFLEDLEDFKFPAKIYDVDGKLRDLIKTSFNHYSKNLGVLLLGNKGQGKSLTAKLLCKEMNLPVVIINKKIPSEVNFINFLNQIKTDFVLFIDEFEKLFEESYESKEKDYHGQTSFLSFMDGVITNESKILFVLTTNERVNSYLMNRPSRIKFVNEYYDLREELFDEIVDDLLKNKDFKDDLKSNVSLANLNIDLLISIINDINLYNMPFSKFKNFYNYRYENVVYEVYRKNKDKWEFDSLWTTDKVVQNNDLYIADECVSAIKKFSKEEIVFTVKGGRDADGKRMVREIRIVPFKQGY